MSIERRFQAAFAQIMAGPQQRIPPTPAVTVDLVPHGVSRRSFLQQAIASGSGLALAVSFGESSIVHAQTAAASSEAAGDFAPNAFVKITAEGVVTIIAMHDEMGQGIHTGLAIAVCEELEIDPAEVSVVHAPAHPDYSHVDYGVQMTGGSSSIYSARDPMRKAGATAREMLIGAAAERWSVDRRLCSAVEGHIVNNVTGKKLTYGELAADAAKLKVPEEVRLKDPKDFTRIGRHTHRVDSATKVRGTALFSFDKRVDGMLTAMVERCPYFGGTLVNFDATKATQVAGVKAVIQVDSGIAVVADGYWSSLKGRRALKIEWDPGAAAMLDSEKLWMQYREMARQEARVVEREGNVEQSLGDNRTFHATYEVPFQAHAPMEPLSCLVTLRDDGGADLVTGSQMLGVDRLQVAGRLGVPVESVRIENCYLGGGFGRRANPASDFLVEAVDVALAAKREGNSAPIKTVWSREDDIRGGWYRPMYVNAVSATFKNGRIDAWRHRIVGQSTLIGTTFEPMMVVDGLDPTCTEGATRLPYAIPNKQIELQTVRLPAPVQWWRSVGHSNTAFAKESFFDECAENLKRDPLELRQELLRDQPRLLRVLNTVAEKAGWGQPSPEGIGRGISVHESFEGFAAHVVEASVEGGVPKIHRIVVAIDCGPVVNPDQVVAQMESGAHFALSSILNGEITFKDGLVEQSNFDDFLVVRMHEAPMIEVHIVDSDDKMGGAGEVGVPGVASAVCSAIYDACGKRIRRLPIGTQLEQ
ncbi:Isoquinoline 1-oxidoreductase subunit beta [Pirellulimonas nuda]|uniref:Isoquinoline 1-oxidoreductase subunit beta n=1 Tax=Pirellulimonas nuda TaxID=2528009 RepID=A0A518DDF1_9BACT|nr:xanthine dehydrogenase family protein molybdopterin-binding subunit [Pirellulimonas nuda]QDU89466.1 Isoquinoline 1-oxidoreductase subunit beta [Pirellulimonas nuda]